MSSLDAIFRSISGEVRSGRIGRGVCVRAHLELSADHGKLTPLLARGLADAFACLGENALDVRASGDLRAGQLSALARGLEGASAIVSVALRRGTIPIVDLLVLGSRGSMRHDGEANAANLEGIDDGLAPDALDPEAHAFLDAVERSLATGKTAALQPSSERR